MLSALKIIENPQISGICLLNLTRNGHTLRGKPPGVARTLEQRLAGWKKVKFRKKGPLFTFFFLSDENPVDPELSKKINIGFPQLKPPRSEELFRRLAHLKKQKSDPNLDKLAKSGKCEFFIIKF